MNFTFKHTWTGETVQIQLNPQILISDIRNNINEIIMCQLSVNNNYKIIIANQECMELAEPIDLNYKNNLKSLGIRHFYIRPDNQQIPKSVVDRERRRINENNNSSYNSLIDERNLITKRNLECGICYQKFSLLNFVKWRNCIHYENCCPSCVNIWRIRCLENNSIPSCPLCRNHI